MTDEIEAGLSDIFEKYRVLWIAVFSGMLLLIIVSILLAYFEVILAIPVVDPFIADKVTLIVLFVLLITIFFLKRSHLAVPKIIERARSSKRVINWDMFPFLDKANEKHTLLAHAVLTTNSVMLIIWLLADMVILVSFVHFILVPFIKTFILYSFVGIYSLIINFPSQKLYKKLALYID